MYDPGDAPNFRRFRTMRIAWRGFRETRRSIYDDAVTLDHLTGRDAKVYLFAHNMFGTGR